MMGDIEYPKSEQEALEWGWDIKMRIPDLNEKDMGRAAKLHKELDEDIDVVAIKWVPTDQFPDSDRGLAMAVKYAEEVPA